MNGFTRIQLRTPNVPGARQFYQALFPGLTFDIVDLPPPLRVRGVPAHWLGYVGVRDLAAASQAFIDHGATAFGPVRPGPAGQESVIFRGPAQEIVGFESGGAQQACPIVGGQLYADGVERARSAYAAALGWTYGGTRNMGALGEHQDFAYQKGAEPFGTFVDIAGLTGIHAHWLFYFAVADLADVLGRAQSNGAIVVGPYSLPGGQSVAMCEDPQKGVFGVRQVRAPATP